MKFRRATRGHDENAVARQISIVFEETLKNRVFDGGSLLFVNGPLGRFEPHTAVVPHLCFAVRKKSAAQELPHNYKSYRITRRVTA